MEFDCSKVLTPFTEGKKKWIGWKGFGSNDATDLTLQVLHCNDNTGLDELADAGVVINSPYRLDGKDFRFFYPIKETAKAPAYRPCKNLDELAISANDGHFACHIGNNKEAEQYSIFNALKGKYVYDKERGIVETINGIDFLDREAFGKLVHLSCYGWVDFNDLFERYEWADKEGDARIIGVKE